MSTFHMNITSHLHDKASYNATVRNIFKCEIATIITKPTIIWLDYKLQPTIFLLSKHVICFPELPAETMLHFLH